jgi:hypothetical protein
MFLVTYYKLGVAFKGSLNWKSNEDSFLLTLNYLSLGFEGLFIVEPSIG